MEAAKNSSNREQARLHNIHESVIRRWRKQISEEQIKEAVKDPNKMTLRLKPFTNSMINLANCNIFEHFVSQIREQMSGPDLHVFTLKFLALKKPFFFTFSGSKFF